MERGSTIFLRVAIVAMGLAVLALCAVILPAVHTGWAGEFPEIAYMRYPLMLGLITTAVAFFVALHQAFRLLNYIDHNKMFTELSIKALCNIQYCAFVIGGVYAVGLPLIYHLAQHDDAPGLVVIGMIFTGVPLVIAVFAGVVQRLLRKVIDMKSENDLTV